MDNIVLIILVCLTVILLYLHFNQTERFNLIQDVNRQLENVSKSLNNDRPLDDIVVPVIWNKDAELKDLIKESAAIEKTLPQGFSQSPEFALVEDPGASLPAEFA